MAAFRRTLPMLLNTTLDSVLPVYRELFQRHGLTEQQWRVLRVLWASGPVTSTELSRETLLPAPSLVGILDRLEKKGLVARIRSEDDRRKVFVTATPAGRALQEAVMPMVERIHARLQGSVEPGQWAAMEETLGRIARATRDLGLDDLLAEPTEDRSA